MAKGRSKGSKKRLRQEYLAGQNIDIDSIPTRDQRRTPPREAYFLVNLLYCVSFLVIGGALLALRS